MAISRIQDSTTQLIPGVDLAENQGDSRQLPHPRDHNVFAGDSVIENRNQALCLPKHAWMLIGFLLERFVTGSPLTFQSAYSILQSEWLNQINSATFFEAEIICFLWSSR